MLLPVLFSLSSIPALSAEDILYAFQGGDDGLGPVGRLIMDSAGDLYGITNGGGGGTGCEGGFGCGTIFKLAPDGTESVKYAFAGGSDGAGPDGGLIADGVGDFYGTTSGGGNANDGTVFEFSAGGAESILYAFKGGTSDGIEPAGGLALDKKGNLYGTTVFGGNGTPCGSAGCGTVFKVTPGGSESVLHAFQGGSDGAEPGGGVIRDANGNLYGTTGGGGNTDNICPPIGCGTVFKIAPDGTESVLYAFQAGNDGVAPAAGLVMDAAGNLYGTTGYGGNGVNCPNGPSGCGTVFKLAQDGSETVLYAFKGGSDGQLPDSVLIMDKAGNLYGTTFLGGSNGCKRDGGGCGTVFKVAPDGTETILQVLGGLHGSRPRGSLLMTNGYLYGTAGGGSFNDGVVFKMRK